MQLISAINDSDLDLEVVPPGLLVLTVASLGNAATDSDGHAEDFHTAVGALTEGALQSAELETLLLEHFVSAFDATSDTLAADTVQLAKDLEKGTQGLHDLDAI